MSSLRSARKALESLVAELRANPRVDVMQAVLNPGADAELVRSVAEEVKARHGIEIPPGLLALYGEVNGFTLVWEPRPTVLVEGRRWSIPPCFNELRPIESLRFGDRAEEFRWSDDDDDDATATAALQFLVDHDQEDQGTFLVAIDGATHLYYTHNQGEDVERLPLDFDTYFARLVALRGFFSWQLLLRRYAQPRHWSKEIFEAPQREADDWFRALSFTP